MQALPDASQASTRLCLPPACAPTADPSVHRGSDHLLGYSLDPEIHCSSHHLSCDGRQLGTLWKKAMTCIVPPMSQVACWLSSDLPYYFKLTTKAPVGQSYHSLLWERMSVSIVALEQEAAYL